jgi:hypothetical protein
MHTSKQGKPAQTVTSKTQTTPSITAQVEHLRSIVAAAVAQTASPFGSMDRPEEITLTPAEIFQVQRDIALKSTGPLPADAILNIQLLGELKVMREQYARQQKELTVQRQQNQALTNLVQALGSKSEPVMVSSHSPVRPTTPFSTWLEQQTAPVQTHPPTEVTLLQGRPSSGPSPSHTEAMNQQQPPFEGVPQQPDKTSHSNSVTTDTAALHQQGLQVSAASAASAPSCAPAIHLSHQNHVVDNVGPSQRKQTRNKPAPSEEQLAYRASQHNFASNALDERIIRQAQERIAHRQSQSHLESMKRPLRDPAKPSRTSEMRIAALTNDEELLRHGSDKVRKEAPSDDEPEEILRELDPAVKTNNLLNPRQPRPTRTKHGYVKSTFIASSDEDDEPPSEGDVDDAGQDSPADDPNDPDWSPSSTPTPSPSRKAISKSEYKEFLEFRRAKKDGNARSHQDTPLPQHQRITVSVAEPPKHGAWNDVHHLVGVFKDEHTTYKHRCGEGTSLTVWECYTQTAKDSIVTFLKSTPKGKLLNRTAAYLAQLSDADLYALLQNELGLTHSTEVEHALRAITFPDSVLDAANWVTFHTSWLQVLHRVSSEVEILPRRMSEIFRESIPDAYITKWLTARKHPTWEEAYSAVIDALSDPKWLVSYIKETGRLQATPAHPQKSLPNPQQKPPPVPKHQSGTPAQQQEAIKQPEKKPRDPLTYKNRYGAINVNPNLNLAVDDNPDKVPCSRCIDFTHRWTSDLCTVAQRRDGTTVEPALTATEFAQRLKKRWEKGFFFKEDLAKATHQHKSPSAKDSNNSSATSASRMTESTAGKSSHK